MYLNLLLVESILGVVQLQLPLLILPGEPVLLNLQLLHLVQDAARQPHRPVLLGPAHPPLPRARPPADQPRRPAGWLAGWLAGWIRERPSDLLLSLSSSTIRRSPLRVFSAQPVPGSGASRCPFMPEQIRWTREWMCCEVVVIPRALGGNVKRVWPPVQFQANTFIGCSRRGSCCNRATVFPRIRRLWDREKHSAAQEIIATRQVRGGRGSCEDVMNQMCCVTIQTI